MSINKQGFTLIYQDGRGEVCAKELVTSWNEEFFPSVFGMEWREDDVHTTAS